MGKQQHKPLRQGRLVSVSPGVMSGSGGSWKDLQIAAECPKGGSKCKFQPRSEWKLDFCFHCGRNFHCFQDRGRSASQSLRTTGLKEQFSTTVPCETLVYCKWAIGMPQKFGGGLYISKAIGRCGPPASDTVCLVNCSKTTSAP